MYLIITLYLDIRKSELLFKTYLVSYCLYSGFNLSTNKKKSPDCYAVQRPTLAKPLRVDLHAL